MEDQSRLSGTHATSVLAEQKLRSFASLALSPAEVRASRDFHVRHWLHLAEAAIQQDHRESLYGSLAPAVESTLAESDEPVAPDLQRAILSDLAFMEGHVEAFRLVIAALRRIVPEK